MHTKWLVIGFSIIDTIVLVIAIILGFQMVTHLTILWTLGCIAIYIARMNIHLEDTCLTQPEEEK